MRLYSRMGAESTVHEGVTYTRGRDGAFDFPEHVGREVHGFHANRVPLWETEVEQQQRFIAEDLARRSDPASQYDLLERIAAKGQAPAPASELAELRKRIAELEAAAQAAAEPEEDGEEPDDDSAAPAAKRARSRKPAAEPAAG